MVEPLIFQTNAAHLLDLMINHPSVRPTIEAGIDRLSSENFLGDHRNVCLAGTGAAALFQYQAPGVYKGHILAIDGSRGALGLAFGRAALRTLHRSHGARLVVAAVPMQLPAARWYVRKLGFVSQGVDSSGLQELFDMEMTHGYV